MYGLKLAKVEVNRKMLSELANDTCFCWKLIDKAVKLFNVKKIKMQNKLLCAEAAEEE